MLKIGDKAPDFTLQDSNGKERSLSEFFGKKIVLYFYPKDNTPGCTKEACSFRDNWERLRELEVIVIGVSPDPPQSHEKFARKYNLPFLLLSDPDKKVLKLYSAWGEKKLYGKTRLGVIRSTYLINEKGVIEHIWKKVRTATHAEDILKTIQ